MKEFREPLWIAWGLAMALLTILGAVYDRAAWTDSIIYAFLVIGTLKGMSPLVSSMEDGIRRQIADPIAAQRLIDRRLQQIPKAAAIGSVLGLGLQITAPWRLILLLNSNQILKLIFGSIGLFFLALAFGVARIVRRRQ